MESTKRKTAKELTLLLDAGHDPMIKVENTWFIFEYKEPVLYLNKHDEKEGYTNLESNEVYGIDDLTNSIESLLTKYDLV